VQERREVQSKGGKKEEGKNRGWVVGIARPLGRRARGGRGGGVWEQEQDACNWPDCRAGVGRGERWRSI
jgi:hypothetical protein